MPTSSNKWLSPLLLSGPFLSCPEVSRSRSHGEEFSLWLRTWASEPQVPALPPAAGPGGVTSTAALEGMKKGHVFLAWASLSVPRALIGAFRWWVLHFLSFTCSFSLCWISSTGCSREGRHKNTYVVKIITKWERDFTVQWYSKEVVPQGPGALAWRVHGKGTDSRYGWRLRRLRHRPSTEPESSLSRSAWWAWPVLPGGAPAHTA